MLNVQVIAQVARRLTSVQPVSMVSMEIFAHQSAYRPANRVIMGIVVIRVFQGTSADKTVTIINASVT